MKLESNKDSSSSKRSDNFTLELSPVKISDTIQSQKSQESTNEILTPADTPSEEVPNQSTLETSQTNSEKQEEKIADKMSTVKQFIQLPPFNPDKVTAWLELVKGRLLAMGVEEANLYKQIRADMPLDIIEKVPDIMNPETSKDTFTAFADKVKDAYGKSRTEEIRDLLRRCDLGDHSPRALMDIMIQKSGNDLQPHVVAHLFLAKLPKEVARMMVAMGLNEDIKTTDELKKMAAQATRSINFENAFPSPQRIAQISNSQNLESDIENLKKEVASIKKRLDKMNQNSAHTNSNDSSGNRQSRNRSRNRQANSRSASKPKIDYNKAENKNKCKFHILYGDAAYHCMLPCSDKDKPLAQKPSKKELNSNAGQ